MVTLHDYEYEIADKSMGRHFRAAALAVMALACLACTDASTRHLLQSGESEHLLINLHNFDELVRSIGNAGSSIHSASSVRPVVGPQEMRTGQCILSANRSLRLRSPDMATCRLSNVLRLYLKTLYVSGPVRSSASHAVSCLGLHLMQIYLTI